MISPSLRASKKTEDRQSHTCEESNSEAKKATSSQVTNEDHHRDCLVNCCLVPLGYPACQNKEKEQATSASTVKDLASDATTYEEAGTQVFHMLTTQRYNHSCEVTCKKKQQAPPCRFSFSHYTGEKRQTSRVTTEVGHRI